MSLNTRQLFRLSWLTLTALPEIHISHSSSSMLDLGLVRLVPPGSYAFLPKLCWPTYPGPSLLGCKVEFRLSGPAYAAFRVP